MHELRRVNTLHLKADVFSYSAIISSCEKCFQWQLAVHFFEQMTASKVAANDIAFNAVLSA